MILSQESRAEGPVKLWGGYECCEDARSKGALW